MSQAPDLEIRGRTMLVEFPKERIRRHGVRASTSSGPEVLRAANWVKRSAVQPAALAVSVANTGAHQSDGIFPRRRHFEIMDRVAPISAMAASIEGQRSITAAKEVG